MTYAPINVDAYTNAYSGALAGMAISGWIVDPNSADYANVASIAGAFAEAFDIVWNNAASLNWAEIQSIQSICQGQFTGHAPGSLNNTTFSQASNWAIPAAACAALVLEGGAYIAGQGIFPVNPLTTPINVETFGARVNASAATNVIALTRALAYAVANSNELSWTHIYDTNASIPLLHTVRHHGPGGIRRGADVFYIEPTVNDTNRLYAAVTGNANNDGLSSSQPMSVPQDAFNAMENYGPVLEGNWKLILAAGTWSVHSQTMRVASREWVVIQGPDVGGHPNIPTAIFDGSGFGANLHGFIIGVGGSPPGVAVWFQDIKCQDYNAGAQNSCGWSQGYGARCIFVNCHADNCDFAGILADQGDICLVKGGIINNCRDGIVLNATKGTIGYSSPFTPGSNTRITNCTEFGIYWSRGAQGHIDNCLMDQNVHHVRLESATRAHIQGTDFRRATTAAISTNTDGSYFDDPSVPNIYNDGTGLANTKRYEHRAYTGNQQNWVDAGISEFCLYAENPGSSLTSAVKAQIGPDLVLPNPEIADAGKLRKAYFVDKKTYIKIKVWGDTPNATASFGVDFFDGVTTSMAYSAFVGTPSAAGFYYELLIAPLTATTQRGYVNPLIGSGGTPRVESGATAANLMNPQTVKLMCQSAAGAMVVRRVEVWVCG